MFRTFVTFHDTAWLTGILTMAYYNPVDNLNNQGFVSTAHLGKRKLVHGGAMSRMWIRVSTPPTWDVQLELGINGSFNPNMPHLQAGASTKRRLTTQDIMKAVHVLCLKIFAALNLGQWKYKFFGR